jgi:hypothetical protein
MGGASGEPAPHTLSQPLSENGGGGSDENAYELERDMQLAFEEQEKSSSAPAPGSPCPRRPSAEPSHPQIEWTRHQLRSIGNGLSKVSSKASRLEMRRRIISSSSCYISQSTSTSTSPSFPKRWACVLTRRPPQRLQPLMTLADIPRCIPRRCGLR